MCHLNSWPSLMNVGPSCRIAPRSQTAVLRARALFLASVKPPGYDHLHQKPGYHEFAHRQSRDGRTFRLHSV